MPMLLTPTTSVDVSQETYDRVEKMRRSVLAQMRAAYRLELAYQGTLRLCGADAPVSLRKGAAYEKAKASLNKKTALLLSTLKGIEQRAREIAQENERAAARIAAMSDEQQCAMLLEPSTAGDW